MAQANTRQITGQQRFKGQHAYHAGLAAEQSALRCYLARGYQLEALRWRGQSGELDLILRDGEAFVFVEVKKSRSMVQAALQISPSQKARILAAAEEFVATQPSGLLSEMRFDVALVDQNGRVETLENALGDG
ncbi:MAG: YraN family protein [Roseobacter sp.]|jgi:putative endonuclease|nr:YraN family protein [Roseobacter sp.]